MSKMVVRSLVGAALLLAGCSESSLTELPGTADPTRVNAGIEVMSLEGDPDVVDFGTVVLGQGSIQEVLLRNVGTDTLQLQDTILDDRGVTLLGLDPDSPLLVPGAEATAQLEFLPIADGLLSASFEVYSNDRANPVTRLDVRGDGLGPALRITPPSFDFGDLEIGCSSVLTVELINEGRAPLTIDGVDIENTSGSGEVSISQGISLPYLLPPNSAITMELIYEPMDVIADTSTLKVRSTDPSAPEAGRSAIQFGTGHPGEQAQDEFSQGGVGLTDVLFVVDNSCSMGNEQTTFAANFPGFVPILEDDGTDYRLAATTTDAGDNGMFVGSVPIVTPSTPDPGGTFAANVVLGTSGAGYEQAMLGGWLALDPANGANPGFLRDAAELHIIFVSDAVDFSTDAGMPFQTPEGYVSAFQGLKDDPDQVILSDISGGLGGCSGAGGSAQGNTNLTTATALTGGISASICDSNWVASLEDLALLAVAIADTFPLTRPAVSSSVEVYLNGSFIPTGWYFSEATNSVVFNGPYVPDDGDELLVNYTVLGGCAG